MSADRRRYFFAAFAFSMPAKNHLLRLVGVAPAQHLHPLGGLEVLVVLEEVLDLLEGDLRQIRVVVHLLVATRELRHRHGDDLLVAARLVLHLQHADRAHRHDRARHHAALVRDEHVARIAVVRQRVRNEPVIARVAHGRVEETVHDQRPGLLVHLVLDGLAADRHFDDDVHFIRRITANGHSIKTHLQESSAGEAGPRTLPEFGGWSVSEEIFMCRGGVMLTAPRLGLGRSRSLNGPLLGGPAIEGFFSSIQSFRMRPSRGLPSERLPSATSER